jgi:hypothetical protein
VNNLVDICRGAFCSRAGRGFVPVVPEGRKVWNKKSLIKSRVCVILVPEFVPGFLYYGTAKRRGRRRNLLFLLELIDNKIREKMRKKGNFKK